MSSFFDKKEDYIEDDFESEREDFLNPSMKDINERNQSQKKRKIKNSPEGIQFIDLASLDSRQVFKVSGRTIENSEYFSMVLRGFVFIFMFLISLLGIFLIFKTPYYSMYNQKEPIILDGNKELITSNPFSKSQEDLKKEIINKPEENNVKIPTGVVSQNKAPIDEDEILRREFQNSKVANNKKDTELTKLLKNNTSPSDSVAKTSNNSEDDFNYPGLADKKMTAQNNSNNTATNKALESNENGINSQQGVSNLQGNTPTQGTINSQNNNTSQSARNPSQNVGGENTLKSNNSEQTTWLVTVYSTSKQDEMSDRLLRLKNRYKNAFNNATFYFVENKAANGAVNYRISVTKTQMGIAYPSFNNATEAKSFCNTLKSQGLDCFVSTVNKSLLPKAIIK